MGGKDCSCEKKKDCGCDKNPDTESGRYRTYDELALNQIPDVLNDILITTLSNYFTDNGQTAGAKVVLNKYKQTRYNMFKFSGNLIESSINSIPIYINLERPLYYGISNFEISFYKNNELVPLSTPVLEAVKRIVCKNITKVLKPQIIAFSLKKSTNPYYSTTLSDILGEGGIGKIVDNVQQALDPENPSFGYVKFLKSLEIKEFKPITPAAAANCAMGIGKSYDGKACHTCCLSEQGCMNGHCE